MSLIAIPSLYAVLIASSRSVRNFSAACANSSSPRRWLSANAARAARASGDFRFGREIPGSLSVFPLMG